MILEVLILDDNGVAIESKPVIRVSFNEDKLSPVSIIDSDPIYSGVWTVEGYVHKDPYLVYFHENNPFKAYGIRRAGTHGLTRIQPVGYYYNKPIDNSKLIRKEPD